jgi:pilus assembly protein Flp/PilA
MWNDIQVYIRMLAGSIAKNEEGQTLVEYGLIIALVSVALIAVLGTLTGALTGVFNQISATLQGA